MCKDKYLKIIKNEELIRKIVRALENAIHFDVKQYLSENRKETNNIILQLKGDCINDNLRKTIVDEEIELIPFKRCAWDGRIIHDKINKVTYSITTYNTLVSILKKKGRKRPHYLQSILAIENRRCKGRVKQLSFDECGKMGFDLDVLQSDFISINQDYIRLEDDYVHYIIAYRVKYNEITNVDLKLLDKDFDIVDEISLNEYLRPDFGLLTDFESSMLPDMIENKVDSKKLIQLKTGIIPNLKSDRKVKKG